MRIVNKDPLQVINEYSRLSMLDGKIITYTHFLCHACPKLTHFLSQKKPQRTKERPGFLAELISQAHASGLETQSLLFIAVASHLFKTDEVKSLGEMIIKPAATYSAQQAWNAISDILLMEHAASLCRTDPALSWATSDLGLAILWCATMPKLNNSTSTVRASQIDKALFADLDDEAIEKLSIQLNIASE